MMSTLRLGRHVHVQKATLARTRTPRCRQLVGAIVRAACRGGGSGSAPFSTFASFSVKPPTTTPTSTPTSTPAAPHSTTTSTSIPSTAATTPPHSHTQDITAPPTKQQRTSSATTSTTSHETSTPTPTPAPTATPMPTPPSPSKGAVPPYEPTKGVTPPPSKSSGLGAASFSIVILALGLSYVILSKNPSLLEQLRTLLKPYPSAYQTLEFILPSGSTAAGAGAGAGATTFQSPKPAPAPVIPTATSTTFKASTPSPSPSSSSSFSSSSSSKPSSAASASTPAKPSSKEYTIDEMKHALTQLREIHIKEQTSQDVKTRMTNKPTTTTTTTTTVAAAAPTPAPVSTRSATKEEHSTSFLISKLNELRQVLADEIRTTQQPQLGTPPTPASGLGSSSLHDAQQRIKQLESYIQEIQGKWKTELNAAASRLNTELEHQKKAFQAERDALLTEHKEHLKHAENEWKQELQHVVREALQNQEREHLTITKSLIQDFTDALTQAAAAEREDRMATLSELKTRIQAFDRVLALQSDYNHISHRVHRLSLALLSIDDVIHTPNAFAQQWDVLETIGHDDPIIQAALQSVPAIVRANGVIPLSTLQSHFTPVETAIRRAAYVPPFASGFLGRAVGRVFAGLTFREVSMMEGDDDLSKLSRATYHLQHNKNLSLAVAELDSLSPQTHELVNDWLEEARDRLIVDQALVLLKARITQLALSLN